MTDSLIRKIVEEWYVRPSNHSDINQDEKEQLITRLEEGIREKIDNCFYYYEKQKEVCKNPLNKPIEYELIENMKSGILGSGSGSEKEETKKGGHPVQASSLGLLEPSENPEPSCKKVRE